MKKLLSFLSITIISFASIAFKNNILDTNLISENKINYLNTNNQLIQSKREVDFPIYTFHKTGNDSEKNVWVFYAEGYTKDELIGFITDIKNIVNKLLNIEPYKSFSNDINIYGVLVESLGTESDGYFQCTDLTLSTNGLNKLKKLNNQIENGFLDEGGKIFETSILVNDYIMRGISTPILTNFKRLSIASKVSPWTIIHEGAHSHANLGDEYHNSADEDWPNKDLSPNPLEVKWKEFLGFRNVTNYKDPSKNSYIPTEYLCLMADTGLSLYPPNSNLGKLFYDNFCEICQYEIFLNLNKNIKNKRNIYIANPSITWEHKQDEKANELIGNLIQYSKNKKIDFRTIISNLSNDKKEIELKLYLKSKKGDIKKSWNQSFTILPNQLKSLQLLTEELIDNISSTDEFYGEIIDSKTKKILDMKSTILEKNTKFVDININYKLLENNQTTEKNIPFTSTTNIKVKKDTKLSISNHDILGYKFIKSNIIDNNIIVDNNKSITFYYEKQKYKEINLQLKDIDENIIDNKKQKIYENEIFNPKISDFILNDKWKKSIPYPLEINGISYNDINDDNIVVIYNLIYDPKPYIIAEDQIIKFNKEWNPLDQNVVKGYYNSGTLWFNGVAIEENNVDITKPGIYYVTYSINDPIDYGGVIAGKNTKTIKVTVLNPDNSLPNIENSNNYKLKEEQTRINNLSLYLLKYRFNQNQLNNLNENTLLKNIYGWNDSELFNYEVINLNKNETNKIKFNIKIELNSDSLISKEFIFNYQLVNNNQENNSLQQEKNRIDNLNLSLKKDEYSQDEINILNESNIFTQYLQGWSTSTNNIFNYEIINLNKNETNKIKFNIKIKLNSDSLISKEFIFNYKFIENNINNIQNNKLNKSELILLITIPIIILILSLIGWLIFLKYKKSKK